MTTNPAHSDEYEMLQKNILLRSEHLKRSVDDKVFYSEKPKKFQLLDNRQADGVE